MVWSRRRCMSHRIQDSATACCRTIMRSVKEDQVTFVTAP